MAVAKPDPNGKEQYSAPGVIPLYEKQGRRIFREPAFAKILSLGDLLDERYSRRYLEGERVLTSGR